MDMNYSFSIYSFSGMCYYFFKARKPRATIGDWAIKGDGALNRIYNFFKHNGRFWRTNTMIVWLLVVLWFRGREENKLAIGNFGLVINLNIS